MKRYIRSSTFNENSNPAFKYYDIFYKDEPFMDLLGYTDEDMEGFRIGDIVSGCKLVGHAVPKQMYEYRLENKGLDLVDIFVKDGKFFPGQVAGDRLYDVTEQVISTFRRDEDDWIDL